jgi:Putative phage abortive infection protein
MTWLVSVPLTFAIVAIVSFLVRFHDQKVSDAVERWGQTGDYFGGILNPILAFASLLALCYTLWMQFVTSTEAARFNAIGKLESLVFELLRLHRENLSSIETWSSGANDKIYGKQVLRAFLHAIAVIHSKQSNESPTETSMAEAYRRFYEDEHKKVEVAHYFRNLYHIFKLIATSPLLTDEQRSQYAKLVRAQLSTPETAMLFYNGLHPHGREFRKYIRTFTLLQELEPLDIGLFGLTKDLMISIYGERAFADPDSAA